MKALSTKGIGTSLKIVTVEAGLPKIGPDDVLVKVYASSVNPKDWKLNTNISSLVPKVGPLQGFHIIGDDLAGVVTDVGKNVSIFAVGDRVYGMDMRLRTSAGASYARIGAKRIAKMPDTLGFNEAASVPLAALTALQAFQIAALKKKQDVLIVGASGGVGTFAVQIAKAMGARVTGVCSGRNTGFVSELGADKVIDYTTDDFRESSDVFNVIFDATAYETLNSCKHLLKKNGTFVSTSGHGAALFDIYRPRIPQEGKKIKPVWVESYTKDLEQLTSYIESGNVKPVIDSVFKMEEAEKAFNRSKSGRSRGKVVIEIEYSD